MQFSSMKAVQMKPLWNSSEYHMAVCTVHQQLTTNCTTEIHGKAMRKSVVRYMQAFRLQSPFKWDHLMSFGPLVSDWLQQQPKEFFVVSHCQMVCQWDMYLMPMGTMCNCPYDSVKNVLNPFTAASFV